MTLLARQMLNKQICRLLKVNYPIQACSQCNEQRPIVYKSGRLCFACNRNRLQRRYAEKQKNKPQKTYELKKISDKGKATVKADDAFYQEIWSERPHRCEECGIFLGDTLKKHFFSHIITKGSHPNLRHIKDNINVLCLTHHQQWETGDRKSMKICSKNEVVISRLKELSRQMLDKRIKG